MNQPSIYFSKTTEELHHEIESSSNIEDYLTENKKNMHLDTLSRHLNRLLAQKNLTKADVVRDSLLDRTYLYQIFSGEKNPSRDKLIAIIFGMHLSAKEAQKTLKLSGNRELYARDARDAIILFSLYQKITIHDANSLLFAHHFPVLGSFGK